MTGKQAIFSRRYNGKRTMHAVEIGKSRTVCDLPIGVGSGLKSDGDYWNNVPCRKCWERKS